MKRREALKGAAGFCAAAASGTLFPAAAQGKLILKASDVHPEGYPTVAAVQTMGKKLEQATNGRITIQMFAAMTLGGEKEAIEQAQLGAIQLARVSVGALGPVIDDLNVINLPFLFRDTAHMQKVIDGPIGRELLDKVSANANAGLVGLCWMDAGARSLYNTKKSIRTLADLKGLKFRVIGNPMFVEMMNALGANGVAMGYDQVFNALQTGVIDGAENNPPSFVFDNHYTVAKHFTLTEHLIVPEMLVLSKKTWNAMSKEDQALVTKASAEAQQDERRLWEQYEKQAMDKAVATGVEIIQIADKKPFQDAVKPVWDKYGPKYAAMIKRIQAVQ
ncbi:tripartite ATP-independent transporter solute receptor, DctP family [Enhydrobacter aerosaccus]|uniref:Tripartite ATP-independent transporter solute receptor, DctP family n=1 Tax=Enhydrobacter aerosaccus TaxID=225324 RepID=A0A1T4TKU0_9HYPH|nr:TRAP transporter substrate-binding protein [Enhydrobacter aerosaccus]SKA41076.1 tripartite ATP-independent transporter solute receptor, DctP family [Enhydrobacter aerosaccus]